MKQIEITLENTQAKFVLKNDKGEPEWERNMEEISLRDLIQKRFEEALGVVYKKGEKLYYTGDIPENFKLTGKTINSKSCLCGVSCKHVCEGCPRAAALSVSHQMQIISDSLKWFEESRKIRIWAIKESWRVEKYKFITEGLETFNMGAGDMCFVMECKMYKQAEEPKEEDGNRRIKALVDSKNNGCGCNSQEIMELVRRNEARQKAKMEVKEEGEKVFSLEGRTMWRLRNN